MAERWRGRSKRLFTSQAAPRSASISRDGENELMYRASWFETLGVAALLTTRVVNLILRSIAERCVSKDEAPIPDALPSRQPEIELRQPVRQLLDAMNHHRAATPENPRSGRNPGLSEHDAIGIDPRTVQSDRRAPGVLDQVQRIRDVDIGRLAVGQHDHELAR